MKKLEKNLLKIIMIRKKLEKNWIKILMFRKKLEKKHWIEMIENPRRPIIHWHVLKVTNYSINL